MNRLLRGLWYVFIFAISLAAIVNAQISPAPVPSRGAGRGGPASQRPPQAFPAKQVKAGEAAFVKQCGFCHGRDAHGAEGPDLTRSPVTADDVMGNKLIPVIREGRTAKGMPAFKLSDVQLAALVAFIHDAKSKAESLVGGPSHP